MSLSDRDASRANAKIDASFRLPRTAEQSGDGGVKDREE